MSLFSDFEISVTSLVLALLLLLGWVIKTLFRRWARIRRRRGDTVPKETAVSNNLFYIHILNTFIIQSVTYYFKIVY